MEEPVSWAASAPVLRSSQEGAASTTNASGKDQKNNTVLLGYSCMSSLNHHFIESLFKTSSFSFHSPVILALFCLPVGAVVRFLMASGFRKDAPTVAVVTASCIASPMSSIKTVVRYTHQTHVKQHGLETSEQILLCKTPCPPRSPAMLVFHMNKGVDELLMPSHHTVKCCRSQ